MKTEKDCLFCKIAAGTIPSKKVYEDEHVVAFLDIKPITKGHTLVIPKNHSSTIQDMDPEDGLNCMRVLQKLGPVIQRAFAADGFNLGNNNGKAAGQVIHHTHFHLIPRWDNDGLSNWPNQDVSEEELEDSHKKILRILE